MICHTTSGARKLMRFLILLFKSQSLEKIRQMDICRGRFQSSRKKETNSEAKKIPIVYCIFYKAQWWMHKLDRHDIPVRLLSSFSGETVFTVLVMQPKGRMLCRTWVGPVKSLERWKVGPPEKLGATILTKENLSKQRHNDTERFGEQILTVFSVKL